MKPSERSFQLLPPLAECVHMITLLDHTGITTSDLCLFDVQNASRILICIFSYDFLYFDLQVLGTVICISSVNCRLFCLFCYWGLTSLFLSDISSVQFSSVSQSCPTLCDPMNRSTPSLPVHHQLPEFTQTHVHRVSDAIQPSHPLSSPSPPSPNPSQHQSLFQ